MFNRSQTLVQRTDSNFHHWSISKQENACWKPIHMVVANNNQYYTIIDFCWGQYWPKRKSIIVILHTKVILLKQKLAIATCKTDLLPFSGVNIGFRSQFHFLLTPHVTCVDQSKLCLHTRYVILKIIMPIHCCCTLVTKTYFTSTCQLSFTWTY